MKVEIEVTKVKALEIEPGKDYVLEIDAPISENTARSILENMLKTFPGSNFAVLTDGIRIARDPG